MPSIPASTTGKYFGLGSNRGHPRPSLPPRSEGAGQAPPPIAAPAATPASPRMTENRRRPWLVPARRVWRLMGRKIRGPALDPSWRGRGRGWGGGPRAAAGTRVGSDRPLRPPEGRARPGTRPAPDPAPPRPPPRIAGIGPVRSARGVVRLLEGEHEHICGINPDETAPLTTTPFPPPSPLPPAAPLPA